MKTMKWFMSAMVIAAGLAILQSCGEDEKPALALTALKAGDIDLNGASSATGVLVNSNIVATFNVNVDQTTTTAITLTRQYDNAVVPISVTVNGAEVTIDPDDDFGTGTLFVLKFDQTLASTDGKPMASAVERNFTSEGTFAVAGAFAHWTFESNADDIIGDFDPTSNQIVDITYEDGRKADAGKAAKFNGTTSIIEITNGDQLMNNGDWTMSVWVKAVTHTDAGKGHFVLGLGAFYGFQFEIFGSYNGFKLAASYAHTNPAGPGGFSEDLWADGEGKTKDNGNWQGWTFSKDFTGSGGMKTVIQDKWAHYVFVYNATDKTGTIYLNGEKIKEQDFDLWPDASNQRFATGLKYRGAEPDVKNELAFGFIQSRAGTMWDTEPWGGYDLATANHFEGLIDDVIIYKKVLTPTEIQTMYNSSKP